MGDLTASFSFPNLAEFNVQVLFCFRYFLGAVHSLQGRVCFSGEPKKIIMVYHEKKVSSRPDFSVYYQSLKMYTKLLAVMVLFQNNFI